MDVIDRARCDACYTREWSRAEEAMDIESRSLQNDFFNAARKEKATNTRSRP
jgi:hypothetical protein